MYTKGATFTELNRTKIYFAFQKQSPAGKGRVTCPGCAKIADGKWLPLILTCKVGPVGHFRSLASAMIADTQTHRTIKAATAVAKQAN